MLPSPEHDPEQVRIRHLVEQAIHDEEPELYLAFAAELLAAARRMRGPDFSPRAKQVVMKWFRRGLSGWKLALVGRSLLGPAFPALLPKPGLHGVSEG
jgi:hypothetical protein